MTTIERKHPIRKSSLCNRKKERLLTKEIEAEWLGSLFEEIRKPSAKAAKILTENVMISWKDLLGQGALAGSIAVYRISTATLSAIADAINFCLYW